MDTVSSSSQDAQPRSERTSPASVIENDGLGPGAVLLVAAERRELVGLLKRIRAKRLDWPLDFAARAECNGRGYVCVANGPGPVLARRAVETAAERENVAAVVSVGFCGALAADLPVASIVVADRILDVERGRSYITRAPRRFSGGNHPRAVVSVNRVAVTVSERRNLGEGGGAAVEMEAAGVAECARSRDLPFYCIRSVSDGADQDLAMDFNRMRDGQGRFSRARIVRAALRRPAAVPALMELARNCRMAADALGEFLADCQF
jgi:adenosylhomocysteine nucleosidase